MERVNNIKLVRNKSGMSLFGIVILLPDKFSSASLKDTRQKENTKCATFPFNYIGYSQISRFSKLWAEGRKIQYSCFFGQKQNYPWLPVSKSLRTEIYFFKVTWCKITSKTFGGQMMHVTSWWTIVSALSTIVSAFRLKVAKRVTRKFVLIGELAR